LYRACSFNYVRGSNALIGLLLLAACERGGPSSEQRWLERKAAAEKLELWSIEAVGSKAPPVHICADVAMRIGFVKPSPALGSAPCVLLGEPVERADLYTFRCQLGDDEWAVSSHWQGDRDRDFTDTYEVTSLDTADKTYAQTRRYRRLGRCPSGWTAGDTRDPQGRRVNRLAPWPGPQRGG
jgi:hypothetical protein